MKTNQQQQQKDKGPREMLFLSVNHPGVMGEGLRGTGQNLRATGPPAHHLTAEMFQGSFSAWKNPNRSLGQDQYLSCFLFFPLKHKPSPVPGIY